MSVVRLVMLDGETAQSGLVPSTSIPAILFAVAKGANTVITLWEKVAEVDPNLAAHFNDNQDPAPLLEGCGDGLLVISWNHYCIESFQSYTPVRLQGTVRSHTGHHADSEGDEVPFTISSTWHLVDHHFEESRH
jgi:hypothetical protein